MQQTVIFKHLTGNFHYAGGLFEGEWLVQRGPKLNWVTLSLSVCQFRVNDDTVFQGWFGAFFVLFSFYKENKTLSEI